TQRVGLGYNDKALWPGAQTERPGRVRGGKRPAGGAGEYTPPGRSLTGLVVCSRQGAEGRDLAHDERTKLPARPALERRVNEGNLRRIRPCRCATTFA